MLGKLETSLTPEPGGMEVGVPGVKVGVEAKGNIYISNVIKVRSASFQFTFFQIMIICFRW